MNTVAIRGTLSRAPRLRELPSGDRLAQLEVTTPLAGGGATSVPVVVASPSGRVLDLPSGAEVLVVGSVQRRFFRAGGATQSRTEVVAAALTEVRRTREARRLLQRAADELLGSGGG